MKSSMVSHPVFTYMPRQGQSSMVLFSLFPLKASVHFSNGHVTNMHVPGRHPPVQSMLAPSYPSVVVAAVAAATLAGPSLAAVSASLARSPSAWIAALLLGVQGLESVARGGVPAAGCLGLFGDHGPLGFGVLLQDAQGIARYLIQLRLPDWGRFPPLQPIRGRGSLLQEHGLLAQQLQGSSLEQFVCCLAGLPRVTLLVSNP